MTTEELHGIVKSVMFDTSTRNFLSRHPGLADVFTRSLAVGGVDRLVVYLRLADDAGPMDLEELRRSARESFGEGRGAVDVVFTDGPATADSPPRPPRAFGDRPVQGVEEPTAVLSAPPPTTPLAGAFAARALRAVDHLANRLPEDVLAGAVSARTDFEALFNAFLESDLVHETGDPLARARVRGVRAARDLVEAEGGSLSGEELGQLLGVSRQAVHARRKGGKVLGLDTGRHGLRYPAWQVTARGLLPGLEEALAALPVHDPWMRARFFLADDPRLGGRRPLDLLRDGDIEPVVEAARAYGEHGAA